MLFLTGGHDSDRSPRLGAKTSSVFLKSLAHRNSSSYKKILQAKPVQTQHEFWRSLSLICWFLEMRKRLSNKPPQWIGGWELAFFLPFAFLRHCATCSAVHITTLFLKDGSQCSRV